ncbi:MAG: hypothetical protein ACKOAS_03255 [Verrucomicrobiota bacterium]
MKFFLLLPIAALTLATSCTTLENRRYLWEEQKVEGPYTRMLDKKPWPWPRKSVDAGEASTQASPAPMPWGK